LTPLIFLYQGALIQYMTDYAMTWTQRVRDEDLAERIRSATDYMDKETRNYSKQKTCMFLMKLGLQRLEDFQDQKEKINSQLP